MPAPRVPAVVSEGPVIRMKVMFATIPLTFLLATGVSAQPAPYEFRSAEGESVRWIDDKHAEIRRPGEEPKTGTYRVTEGTSGRSELRIELPDGSTIVYELANEGLRNLKTGKVLGFEPDK